MPGYSTVSASPLGLVAAFVWYQVSLTGIAYVSAELLLYVDTMGFPRERMRTTTMHVFRYDVFEHEVAEGVLEAADVKMKRIGSSKSYCSPQLKNLGVVFSVEYSAQQIRAVVVKV